MRRPANLCSDEVEGGATDALLTEVSAARRTSAEEETGDPGKVVLATVLTETVLPSFVGTYQPPAPKAITKATRPTSSAQSLDFANDFTAVTFTQGLPTFKC